MTAQALKDRLATLGDTEKAAHAQRFFKTGPGQYGEGDLFRGIRVPVLRAVAKEFQAMPLAEAVVLLQSPMHEERLVALFILVRAFNKRDAATKQAIYDLYLQHGRPHP